MYMNMPKKYFSLIFLWTIIIIFKLPVIAQHSFRDSIELIINKTEQKKKLETYDRFAEKVIEKFNPDEALKYFSEFKETAVTSGNSLYEAEAYRYMGRVYFKKGDMDNAISLFSKSVGILEKTNNIHTPEYILAINDLGRMYYHKDSVEKAIEIFKKPFDIYSTFWVRLNDL